MSDQAKVSSIEAIEEFRSRVIVYVNQAHSRLDEVGDEVRRTRSWLQTEQRMHWEGEIRRRKRVLDQAEAELMNSRLSSMKDSNTLQMLAVTRARLSLQEAEGKLLNVKRWFRVYESQVSPLLKKLESLRSVLDREMPKALAYLLQIENALEAYAESGPVAAAVHEAPVSPHPSPES
ncbi:hypothetical protein TSACC_3501 [Terrimicrobium sacchariphilum]|uniref:Uncharacterized protein n=1 Tax=Terrimicrobium sacchariphilum TaxID=690879 RepID=A0A146GD02_TERSA|nr:hypothetical protein [Terrimicrobium sacchariphilum]GAT35435.1 hypothetical protein TSACC_3501 [Terrimicrobium sacchariphilum]